MDCIVHGVAKSQTGLRDGKGKKYQNIPWKTERISDTHFYLRMDGSLLKKKHTHTHTHTCSLFSMRSHCSKHFFNMLTHFTLTVWPRVALVITAVHFLSQCLSSACMLV